MCNCIVGGLIPDISVEDIEKRFSVNKNVTITSVDVIRRDDGQCKGFAYVNLSELLTILVTSMLILIMKTLSHFYVQSLMEQSGGERF